jgi:hypothetical protein
VENVFFQKLEAGNYAMDEEATYLRENIATFSLAK